MEDATKIQDNAAEFARITNVSRETFCLYAAWHNLLTHWNKSINLVSPSTIHNYWLRHALDSWQAFDGQEARSVSDRECIKEARSVSDRKCIKEARSVSDWECIKEARRAVQTPVPGLDPGTRDHRAWIPHQVGDNRINVLDLGSGAGFPGLAAAIHFRAVPNAHVYLVEANGKKCNFLRAVIRELDLPATAIQARAEHVPEALRNKHFNIITARAFAPLPKLLEYCAPYWSVDKLGSTHTRGIPPCGGMSGEHQEARRANARPGMNKQEARSISDRECIKEARSVSDRECIKEARSASDRECIKEARREQSERPGVGQEARRAVQTPVPGLDPGSRDHKTWAPDQVRGLESTLAIFPKGRNWQAEVTAARKHWSFELETTPSQTDEDARILLVTNLKKMDSDKTSREVL